MNEYVRKSLNTYINILTSLVKSNPIPYPTTSRTIIKSNLAKV